MFTERRNVAQDNEARDAYVRREADGAVVVEGRDRGRSVAHAFGPDAHVYQWAIRIPLDQIPALMAALGLPGDDPLDAVAEWFRDESGVFELFLDAHGVVHESWSFVPL